MNTFFVSFKFSRSSLAVFVGIPWLFTSILMSLMVWNLDYPSPVTVKPLQTSQYKKCPKNDPIFSLCLSQNPVSHPSTINPYKA